MLFTETMPEDIIEDYKAFRVSYGNRNRSDKALDVFLECWQDSDLEKLASFAAKSIISDDYGDQIQSFFPLYDLRTLEKLDEKKGILHKEEALQAVYHLIEDYLKPADEQSYGLGPLLTDVISSVTFLGLEKEVDIDYIDRAIERARKDGHHAVADNWEHIKGEIIKARESK